MYPDWPPCDRIAVVFVKGDMDVMVGLTAVEARIVGEALLRAADLDDLATGKGDVITFRLNGGNGGEGCECVPSNELGDESE
jgi:hypothetical protein